MSPRRSVTYIVEGTPRPKGSRVSGVTKTGVRYNRESNPRAVEAYKAMRKRLSELHREPPLQPPYHVVLTFYFPEPKSNPSWPRSGDCDKYARLVLDAACAKKGAKAGDWQGIIEDDRHVIELSAVKRYGEPRTEITVHEAGH